MCTLAAAQQEVDAGLEGADANGQHIEVVSGGDQQIPTEVILPFAEQQGAQASCQDFRDRICK